MKPKQISTAELAKKKDVPCSKYATCLYIFLIYIRYHENYRRLEKFQVDTRCITINDCGHWPIVGLQYYFTYLMKKDSQYFRRRHFVRKRLSHWCSCAALNRGNLLPATSHRYISGLVLWYTNVNIYMPSKVLVGGWMRLMILKQ